MNYSKALRQIRLQNDWTLRELCQHLGVNLMTVWRWEQGITTPSILNEYKIRQLLKGGEQDIE